MLYKITSSDFFYNGKLFPEGSCINLPDSEAVKFPNILLPSIQKIENNSDNPESITVELPKRKRKK
ncbi:MAG: hypothetical protein GYA14_14215 [Ignavibacteria bacterium]|nr:hypothetical protein [Ignavibacteria bacterium]